MKASVNWQQSESGLDFSAIMDDGKSLNLSGDGSGLSPMQVVLMSVGACSSVDVVEILRKSRQDIQGCVCDLEAKRSETAPRVFTKIHAHYTVSGSTVKLKQLERAVQLSTEKYCSVMLMLHKSVDISTSFELIGTN